MKIKDFVLLFFERQNDYGCIKMPVVEVKDNEYIVKSINLVTDAYWKTSTIRVSMSLKDGSNYPRAIFEYHLSDDIKVLEDGIEIDASKERT